MSISINFELLEIYPPDIISSDRTEEGNNSIVFTYDTQIIEVKTLCFFNCIETPRLTIKVSSDKKEIKIPTKLFKGGQLLGSGDFIISSTILQKKEEVIKKWLTLNSVKNGKDGFNNKMNFAMSLVNLIKLSLKVTLNYSDSNIESNSISDVGSTKKINHTNTKNNFNVLKNSARNFRNVIENFKIDITKKEKDNIKGLNLSTVNFLNRSINVGVNSITNTKNKLNNRIKNRSCDNASYLIGYSSPIAYASPSIQFKKNMTNSKFLKNSSCSSMISSTRNNYVKNSKFNLSSKIKDKILPSESLAKINKNNLTKKEVIITSPPITKREQLIEQETVLQVKQINEDQGEVNYSDLSSNSFIDIIFDETNETNNLEANLLSGNFENYYKEFKSYYNDELLNILPNDPMYLQFEFKMLVEKIFELRDHYYFQIRSLKKHYCVLKKFLTLYNEKFRLITKKINRLKQHIESNHIKHTLNSFVNKQEIIRTNFDISLFKKQLDILKFLFNASNNEAELNMFRFDSVESYHKDKNILFELAGKIFGNSEIKEKLTNGQKMLVNRMFNKNREDNKMNNMITIVDLVDPFELNKFSPYSNLENQSCFDKSINQSEYNLLNKSQNISFKNINENFTVGDTETNLVKSPSFLITNNSNFITPSKTNLILNETNPVSSQNGLVLIIDETMCNSKLNISLVSKQSNTNKSVSNKDQLNSIRGIKANTKKINKLSQSFSQMPQKGLFKSKIK